MGEAVDKVVRLAATSTRIGSYLRRSKGGTISQVSSHMRRLGMEDISEESEVGGYVVRSDNTLSKASVKGTVLLKRKPGKGWQVQTTKGVGMGEQGPAPDPHGTFDTLDAAITAGNKLLSGKGVGSIGTKLFGFSEEA